MKVGILLLSILLFSSTLYADDVFILGDSYSGNTDNKWKNRLENDGHTVSNIASTYLVMFHLMNRYTTLE